MKELDVKECEFGNSESCYHFTRAVYETTIAENGLIPTIGVRSKDGVGNEKTFKVFFAKSLEGALIFLNRNFNAFYSAAKYHNFASIKGALKDDSPELYEQIFTDMVHPDMSPEDLNEVALALGKLYLERGIYYKLDLRHCTREEFQAMDELAKNEIDYLSDDMNEERPNEHPTINNMHTRSGRGIQPNQMALITANGRKSTLDIAVCMAEFYQVQHPGKALPVLEFSDGEKDQPLLEMLVTRIRRKDTAQLGQETLAELKDSTLLEEIEQVQKGEINKQKEMQK